MAQEIMAIRSTGNEPGGGGKPKSKPPLDLSILDLLDECMAELTRVENDEAVSLAKLERLRHRVRTVLGYEVGVMVMPNFVCHQCGGPLVVARDASSAVECAEQCGVSYPTCTWLDLLAQQEAS